MATHRLDQFIQKSLKSTTQTSELTEQTSSNNPGVCSPNFCFPLKAPLSISTQRNPNKWLRNNVAFGRRSICWRRWAPGVAMGTHSSRLQRNSSEPQPSEGYQRKRRQTHLKSKTKRAVSSESTLYPQKISFLDASGLPNEDARFGYIAI